MSTPRTLPLRLAPLPGEALDSWLEAFAHRLQAPLGDLAAATGLTIDRRHERRRGPHSRSRPTAPDWTIHLNDDEVSALAAACGTSPETVRDLTLSRFQDRAVRIDPQTRKVDAHTSWGRPKGSRFCPECLHDSAGRWQLSWRLGWAFACPLHRCLLADDCTGCRRLQRRTSPALTVVPRPGHCADAAIGAIGTTAARCDFDLTQVPVLSLPPQHPVLRAQELLWACINQDNATFGIYAPAAHPVAVMLADLRVLARKVLAEATLDDLGAVLPADLVTAYAQARARPHTRASPSTTNARPGFLAPARAVITATAVTAVLPALQIPDPGEATDALRWLLHPDRPANTGARVTFRTNPLTPELRDILNTIRTQPTSPPIAGHSPSTTRTRHVPTLLWPAWTIRLAPRIRHHRFTFPTAAQALAVLLARNGATTSIETVLGDLRTRLPAEQITLAIRRMEDDPHWSDALEGLRRLADHLDTQEQPIDYNRRRNLNYRPLLPEHTWKQICASTASIPGHGDRLRTVRRWLFEHLSGMPADLAPPPDTLERSADRARVAAVTSALTPDLLTALNEHAKLFLADQNITGEPIICPPPTALLEGLRLPGTDPSRINTHELHRLIREENLRPRAAAHRLGTSIDAVRHLLTTQPATRPNQGHTELSPEPGK